MNVQSEQPGVTVDRRTGLDRRRGDRRRGRPRLAEDVSQMSFKLPAALHDKLVAAAVRREADVSETVRALLEFALEAERLFRISKI